MGKTPDPGVGCQGSSSARLLLLGAAPGWAWGQMRGSPTQPHLAKQGGGSGKLSGAFALLGSLLPGALGAMEGFGDPSLKPQTESKHHFASPNQIIRHSLVHIQ